MSSGSINSSECACYPSQILDLGTLAKLMEMVHFDSIEEATKPFYAISTLIRSNFKGQDLFYMEAGDMMIQNILSNSSIYVRLLCKSVFLLADLVQCQLERRNATELSFFSNHLLKSIVDQASQGG